MKKYVYRFEMGNTDGGAEDNNLLGGKGANLAEMSKLDFPVPAGFTISTECCNTFLENNYTFPESLKKEVSESLKYIENIMGMTFGDPENPLLVSARSGARSSMPGMMETVLNIGLSSKTIPGLIKKTGNEWFVYDAYRRLMMMYSDVVMEKAENLKDNNGDGIRYQLEDIMTDLKNDSGYESDTDLSTDDLKELCRIFKLKIKAVLGKEFPDNPNDQLWGAISAVFKSWNGKRAKSYRKIEKIPDSWGTAVNIQSMVFGNMGNDSATGVAFSRNPATGENVFYGEWLQNAQGEDVVAGIRTPNPINNETKNEQNRHLPSLEEKMPEIYHELNEIRVRLENHYKDMQDIEFTIQNGKLYMLQCRIGKRTGQAALNMAIDMVHEGLIDKKTAVMRVKPEQLDELLHPVIDKNAEEKAHVIVKGLPAGPGGASGQIVFNSEDAVEWKKNGHDVILVRIETNPEDVEGMRSSKAILTSRGGMTSHAALVARGWGKCCIVGADKLNIDLDKKTLISNGKTYNEGDFITLNGTRGIVYEGQLSMVDASENPGFRTFMDYVDEFRTMGIRTNAETPEDATIALNFGTEGIGLFRTEHMFYGKGSEKPLFILRKMILSQFEDERQDALRELFPYLKSSFKKTLEIMDGLPVTIRLLDPPLHEFVPISEINKQDLAEALNITLTDIEKRSENLKESNPMMGHRGVRLGITYPEITCVQIKALFEASAELLSLGKHPLPEIMVPVTCSENEINVTKTFVSEIYQKILTKHGIDKIDYKYGTMIEIPRACFLADKMAETTDFFSFGTNDLTQMTFGFSRDDIGYFLSDYLEKGILKKDPFQTVDQEGVAPLISHAVNLGKKSKPGLKTGVCGEHGGDPESIKFFYKIGLDYVSCSPYRVPVARLSAAQAAITG